MQACVHLLASTQWSSSDAESRGDEVCAPPTHSAHQAIPDIRNLQRKPSFRASRAQALLAAHQPPHLHRERACMHHLRDKMYNRIPAVFCTFCLIWTQRCCAAIKPISSRVNPCLCLPVLFSWYTSWCALQACQNTAAFAPLRQEGACSSRTKVPLVTNSHPL